MTTVFLVPRRADKGHRDRLWAWARARWEQHFPDVPVFEGHHDDGPFSRSAAINRAAEAAGSWDYGIVIDSDVFLQVSQVRKAIRTAKRTGRVTWAHRRWRGLSEEATERVVGQRVDFGPEYEGHDMDLVVERTNPLSWSCCVVIPRAVWDDMGGFDERFRGWGFEDMAFMSVVCGLYGHERIEGDVYHLWHPRSGERITKGQSRITATPEYVTNARLGRRYMVALRRDHQMHDRPPSSEVADFERDIANLKRDDAAYALVVKRHRMPDWSDWWPPLRELVEGAKAAREPEPVGVTLVVRSGGRPENWTERSQYLRASLVSLNEKVTGPIIQRVLYADWPDICHAELRTIAEEHGFYVVGEGHHGYTASTARLWKYLERRAKGAYVFASEDDFLFREPVDLADLVKVLDANAHLAQVALLREPAYESERRKGGILGWPLDSFQKVRLNGYGWLEHRNFWTMNPTLFRRSITSRPWPQRESSERIFGDLLLRENAQTRFAFWGDGQAQIEHIGEVRAGVGY